MREYLVTGYVTDVHEWVLEANSKEEAESIVEQYIEAGEMGTVSSRCIDNIEVVLMEEDEETPAAPDNAVPKHTPSPELDGETNTYFCAVCNEPLDEGQHFIRRA